MSDLKAGTHHWWMQRITAMVNIPLTLWFVVAMVGLVGADFATLVAWVEQPIVAGLLILFIANVTYHLRLGLQVAIEDYVPDHGKKVAAMRILTFVAVALAAVGIFSVLKISLGS